MQRHYYKYLKGETTSTNSVATLFAWTGALRKRGELDGNEALVHFAQTLEQACLDTLASGVMTRDLCGLAEGVATKPVDSLEFIRAIRANLEAKLA